MSSQTSSMATAVIKLEYIATRFVVTSKKKKKCCKENCRPLKILSNLSKAYEKLIIYNIINIL